MVAAACSSDGETERAASETQPVPATDPPKSPQALSQSIVTPSASPTPSSSTVLEKLAAGRAKWAGAMISDYEFDLTISCFCDFSGQPVTVVVRGGSVTLTHADGTPLGEKDRGYDIYTRFSTVERIFAAVEEELSPNDRTADASRISFDSAYGYPKGSLLYQNIGPDAGVQVSISGFSVLGK